MKVSFFSELETFSSFKTVYYVQIEKFKFGFFYAYSLLQNVFEQHIYIKYSENDCQIHIMLYLFIKKVIIFLLSIKFLEFVCKTIFRNFIGGISSFVFLFFAVYKVSVMLPIRKMAINLRFQYFMRLFLYDSCHVGF